MAYEIIAEAGSNHNGSIEDALKLVDVAAESSADFVKFQFIFPEGLYVPSYFDHGSYLENSVFEQRKKELLSFEEWSKVFTAAKSAGLKVFSSVFCYQGVTLLKKLGASVVKVASTDLNNPQLTLSCIENFDRVILSTGMSSLSQIEKSLSWLENHGNLKGLELMHCVSAYPCKTPEANLGRLAALKSAFGLEVGYSDHTQNFISAVAAAALGCVTFEKHFTFNKQLAGFDHKYASDPVELREYIRALRDAEFALQYRRQLSEVEIETSNRARRGIYAASDLSKGHVLSESDLLIVRPLNTLTPLDVESLVGKVLSCNFKKYQPMTLAQAPAPSVDANTEAICYWESEMVDKGMPLK